MFALLSLLPASEIIPPGQTAGQAFGAVNLAALFIILILAGLTVGQGVHTAANNIEKAFYWFAKRLLNTFSIIRATTNKNLNLNSIKYQGPIDEYPLRVRVYYQMWNNILEWMRRRYWGVYDSLVSHRILLGKVIEWNFYPSSETARWVEGSQGELYEKFASQAIGIYDFDLRKLDTEEIAIQYPLLTTTIGEGSTFRRFQAIYSFCRSMWVVLLATTVVFSDRIYTQFIFGTYIATRDPVAFMYLSESMEMVLPFVLGISAIVFFDAAGTYKRHMIEYLIAEFAILPGDWDDSKKTTIDDYI